MNSSGCPMHDGDGTIGNPFRVANAEELYSRLSGVFGVRDRDYTIQAHEPGLPAGVIRSAVPHTAIVRLANGLTRQVYYLNITTSPSGATPGLARWQIALLIFATVGFAGFVYLTRPETEEEKRAYRRMLARQGA